VDDHQQAFSRRVAADGTVLLAETEDQFRAHVESVLVNGSQPIARDGHDPREAAMRFEEVVLGLVGEGRKATRRTAPGWRKA